MANQTSPYSNRRIDMAQFNATAYSAASSAYNAAGATYIDGTVAAVSASGVSATGLAAYGGTFGNVMCAFMVDNGDSVFGGNVIVPKSVNVAGNLVAITSPAATTARSTYALYYPVPLPLIARYPFSGDILNYASGAGVAGATANAAAVYNTTSFAVGTASYSFTGGAFATSNWITLPIFTATSAMTVCIWYNTATTTQYSRFFDYGNLRLYLMGVNSLGFNNTGSFTASTAFNTWNHVAITINGTSAVIYTNGVQTDAKTLAAAISITSVGYFGHSYGADANYVGLLNDYRVYGTLLTASQILAIYNKTM